MRLMTAGSAACAEFLEALRGRGGVPDPTVEAAVREILEDVRRRGDAAAARSSLCRARYLDDESRWDFEIGRELAALEPRPEP